MVVVILAAAAGWSTVRPGLEIMAALCWLALLVAVVALTIAQMYGVELTLAQQALVLLTALLASVGAAGIPMAGLVMLVVVLQAVGLPLEGIATIIAVDRILDMGRTATNVWSDLVGTAVISRFEGSSS